MPMTLKPGARLFGAVCTKAGDGVPAPGGELLQLKEAKSLPASD